MLVVDAAELVPPVQKHVVVAEQRQLVEPLNETRIIGALDGSLDNVVHGVIVEGRGSWP